MQQSSDQAALSTANSNFSAAELEALLNAAVDGIIVTDVAGGILRFNQAAERMLGYQSDEVVGQSVDMIMNERDARAHHNYMDHYLETGQRKIIGIGREVVARRKDGSTFPVALSIGEARFGNERHFVGLIRDLTAQQAAEEQAIVHREQLNHVGRLTTMGEMAAAMAHELNQPLAAIANYTGACLRLLGRDDSSIDEVSKALSAIDKQAHRAAEVIQRIRDFARGRSAQRASVEVRSLISEILPLAAIDAKANHTDLRIRIEKDLPSLWVDRVEIQQVILNLLRNGVDAMSEVPENNRRLDLRIWKEDPETVHIAITDRGHGVSEQAAEQLFTPFFTTKKTGMGMGLAISRSIIKAHGGSLEFRNNPVCGATFDLLLPTRIEAADPS
jgi:two-component system sensor kinase FixL